MRILHAVAAVVDTLFNKGAIYQRQTCRNLGELKSTDQQAGWASVNHHRVLCRPRCPFPTRCTATLVWRENATAMGGVEMPSRSGIES